MFIGRGWLFTHPTAGIAFAEKVRCEMPRHPTEETAVFRNVEIARSVPWIRDDFRGFTLHGRLKVSIDQT